MSNFRNAKRFFAVGAVSLALAAMAACGTEATPSPVAQSTAPVAPTVSSPPAIPAASPSAAAHPGSQPAKPQGGQHGSDFCPYSQDEIESIVGVSLGAIDEMTGPFHLPGQPDPTLRCAYENESEQIRVVITTSEYPKGSPVLVKYLRRQGEVMRRVELDGDRVQGGVSDITALANYRQDTSAHSYYVQLAILRGKPIADPRRPLEQLYKLVNSVRFGH